MTPLSVIRQASDAYTAKDILAALKAAGYIIVRHDAIKLAQAHARDEGGDRA